MKIILLIDDDVEDHDTISQAFYSVDPTVHCLCYQDCSEAIIHLSSHAFPQVHCILIDLHMPRMTGLECLKALRTLPVAQNVDIIMISSQFREQDLEELCRHGAKALCIKPSTWPEHLAMAEVILNNTVKAGTILPV